MMMRLRTKFIFLIAGTMTLPFIAIFLMVQVAFLDHREGGGNLALHTIRLMDTLERLSNDGSDLESIPKLLQEASPGTPVLVFDSNRKLLFSSLEVQSMPDLISLSASGRRYSFHQVRVPSHGGGDYIVVVGIGGGNVSPGPLRSLAVLVVFGPVLLFMTLMSIFIIRSINISIAKLEVATRRISEGDLDFKLETKGNDSIASLTRSFDIMRERVKEETATRSRFIMAISHDLKTPLSSITGYLDAIHDGLATDPDQLARYLAIIRDKTELLESRIRQLIDYVKLETSEWKQRREELPLADYLGEAATVFAAEAEARGFSFSSSIQIDAALLVPFDGDLVFRALENLVQNSFRYAEERSLIRFTAEDAGRSIKISVTNLGETIAEKDLPFIFEPFYRGSKARAGSGFGLGLSVVKSVVESHGWALEVSSQNRETRFVIVIPRA
jgi:signal transduction histidine kinase